MKHAIAFIIALLIIAALILCGCKYEDGQSERMMLLESTESYNIYVDTKSGVEYICRSADSTMTPLIDSYGNPYIHPAFDAREDKMP